ncbi:hypothetical protein [Paenimyroides ceti]
MSKLKSITKKAKTIAKSGIEPYQEGKHNFENENPDVEALALKRSEICSGCEYFKTEPIKKFHVTDDRIPVLSKMYCEDCGCISSFKLRQSIEVCKKWRE